MKRPLLSEIVRSQQVIDSFGGYCRRSVVPMGQFYDMQNMTADEYPVLAPRKRRGMVESGMGLMPEALHGWDVLWSLRTNEGGATRLYRGNEVIGTDGSVGGTPYELKPWAKPITYTYDATAGGMVCPLTGDVDGDGTVKTEDARSALQAAIQTIVLTGEEVQRGDLNANGRVDMADALNILKIATQKITLPLPAKGDRFQMTLTEEFDRPLGEAVTIRYNDTNYAAVYKSSAAMTYDQLPGVGKPALFVFDGANFVYTENRGTLPRSIVSMGGYIVIFPDKVAYNTIFSDPNATDRQKEGQKPWTELEHVSGVVDSAAVKVTPCRLADDDFADITITRAATVPASPTNGAYWYDTENKVLKQYSETDEKWVSVATVYTRIEATGIGVGFKEYDGVNLQMTDADGNTVYDALNGDTVLWGVGDDYLVVTGLVDSDEEVPASMCVTVTRRVPDMDYVVEYGNRLWGCSSDNHEIYCSKLGDPTNWNCFMGVSTDSYAATVGSPGDFTGAATVGGYVLFFKENAIHRVYGTKPANFQITTLNTFGIQAGCAASAVTVDEVLYYKGVRGVYATTGNMPSPVSDTLGNALYTDAVGGRWDRRYAVSMQDEDGGRHLFVYDPKAGLWHRQDDTRFLCCAAVGDDLYYAERASETEKYAIKTMGGSLGYAPYAAATAGAVSETAVKWYAETGDIEASTPECLTLAQIRLRMMAERGSLVTVSLRYDDEPYWQEAWTGAPKSRQIITLPLIPRRCGKLRMRIEGTGDCRVYAMILITEEGSELRGGV